MRQRLSEDEFASLLEAAELSLFGEWWLALIRAVSAARIAPLRLLGHRTMRVPIAAQLDVAHLSEIDCPFDLESSRWGHETMLLALRRLSGRAGIADAEEVDFECLYAK